MKEELENKIINQFSFMQNINYGLEIDDGWFELIFDLCSKINQCSIPNNFQVSQVKEKFGGLRFYVDNSNEEIRNLIIDAESKSYKICEACGEPGYVKRIGWFKTYCDKHHQENNINEQV